MIESNKNVIKFNFNKFLIIIKDNLVILALIFILSGIISYYLSFSFENYFRSKTVIASSSIDINGTQTSSQSQSGLGGLFQSFSSLSQGNGNIRTIKEIALSRDFILNFIDEYSLQPILLASKDDGNRKNGDISFNLNIYDPTSQKFINSDYIDLETRKQAVFEVFSSLITIEEEPLYPILKISFDFKDSKLGTSILKKYINYLETVLESRVIMKAEKIEQNLNKVLTKKTFIDLNESITQEIYKQLIVQLYGTSDISSQFFILESPHSMDKRVSPNRPLFVILVASILTLMAVILILVIKKNDLVK